MTITEQNVLLKIMKVSDAKWRNTITFKVCTNDTVEI